MAQNVVQDIDRPDVNGTPAKMKPIEEQAQAAIADLGLGTLRIQATDNIMSCCEIRGTVEPKDQWTNAIFHNAQYFIFHLVPAKGMRYYNPGDKITAEIVSTGCGGKWRKYTSTPEKVIAKVKAWLEAAID